MTIHNMGLQQKYFDFIKSGTKRIELRLYDDKRKQIQLGDQIEFSSPEGEKILLKVIGLLRYQTFRDLANDFDIELLADKSMTEQDLMNALEEFYTPEKQQRSGVIGIRLQEV